MVVTIWDIFKYIFKWKTLIVIITCLSLLFAYLYVGRIQSYKSEVIIRFEQLDTTTGKTYSGRDINVYEMLSPNIISNSLDEINSNGNIESIRASITITPIIPPNIKALQESKIKQGEEYVYYPSEFSVSYRGNRGQTSNYVRDLLDAIIKNYTVYYSKKYLNQSAIPEINYDIQNDSYDYLETAEIFQENTIKAISVLDGLIKSNSTYRSPSTGYSFPDLMAKYSTFKDFDLPTLFSDILRGKITKNKEVLIKKYEYRRDKYNLTNINKSNESKIAFELMKKFANENVDVPNSYNRAGSSNNDNIATTDVEYKASNDKTTYDELMDKYVKFGVSAINNKVESEYCQLIINIFSKTDDTEIDKEKLVKKIENKTSQLANTWENLTKITSQSIDDYNSYLASQEISYVTGAYVDKNVVLQVYLIFFFILGLSFSIVLAIGFELIKKYKEISELKQEKQE